MPRTDPYAAPSSSRDVDARLARSSRPDFDLSIYLVTDTDQCGGPDGVVRTVREAVGAGATLVQLRDHHLADPDFVALGRQLVGVLAPTGVPLLIDDRVHLVAPIGAQGAHVGQNDMPIDQARAMLGPNAILGLSTQEPSHVSAARALGDELVDYLGVGALHSTGTKPEAGDLGMSIVESVVAVSPWPVCAIGGVKAADAEPLAAIGCRGMSVVSAICGQDDVPAATGILVDAWAAAIRRHPAPRESPGDGRGPRHQLPDDHAEHHPGTSKSTRRVSARQNARRQQPSDPIPGA